MSYKVPLAYASFRDEEIDAAHRVLASGHFTQGKEVARFEEQLAAWHGVRRAVLVNSGSSANLVAIEALIYLSRLRPDLLPTGQPIHPGDEAIIQGLNWPSTIKPLLNLGVRPVFCDVDIDSLNASVETVEAARTERTRVVIAVPVLGNPSHLDALRAYCQRERLLLIEDACESLGAVTESGAKVGTLGAAGSFSFYFSHHISTIEGGAILTDDDRFADMMRGIRAHGWSRDLSLERFLDFDASAIDPRFCFVLPGYNVRSTEINAALGQVQLARLGGLLESRRAIASRRNDTLAGHASGAYVPGRDCRGVHSWMTTPILYADRTARDRARTILEKAGIETRPIIVGNILRHPAAAMFDLSPAQSPLPICDSIFDRGIMIGLNPMATEEQEAFVCEMLIEAADG